MAVAERTYEAHQRNSLVTLHAVEGVRTFSEELRRDLWTMRLEDEPSLSLTGKDRCSPVHYVVRDRTLYRDGTGCGARAIASGVEAIDRKGNLISLTFAEAVDAEALHRTTIRVGLASQEAKK